MSHTARLSPSKSSTPTTVPNVLTFLRIPQPYFPLKKQTHTIWNNRPHIVDPPYRGRTKVVFWFGVKARKGGCTVISRSFPRSVDIVACPVQRRFAHRGKFQELFSDRGEIISNFGYSTSFPRNQKPQCRNPVH